MMKITICIGSSCHLKGSREVVEGLQKMIARDGLKDKIELAGTFCLGKRQTGVNVLVDDERYSVSPDTVEEFYRTTVLPKLK